MGNPEMEQTAKNAVNGAPSKNIRDAGALKTPSWSSIVEAYHADGNGDREMLLALLTAKSKEDERLAALDILKAEQLRAYSTHIAVHGPLFPSTAKPAPKQGIKGSLAPPLTVQPQGVRPIRTPSNTSTSRSPSLSASRPSSPELDALKTPLDEARPRIEAASQAKPTKQKRALPSSAPAASQPASSSSFKRKKVAHMAHDVPAEPTVFHSTNRAAPLPTNTRTLPGIGSLLPPNHPYLHQHRQAFYPAPLRSPYEHQAPSYGGPAAPAMHNRTASGSPKSLQSLLNAEENHRNNRVVTSDVRGA